MPVMWEWKVKHRFQGDKRENKQDVMPIWTLCLKKEQLMRIRGLLAVVI